MKTDTADAAASPDVSIIIPAYNQARWIADTLKSVQAQTCPSWECIVVNDGSTDETVALVKAAAAVDGRIHLLTQTNGGVSSARNRGLDAAKGTFLLFLDGDDLLLPHKLEYQLDASLRSNADVHVSAIQLDWARDRKNPLHGKCWLPPAAVQDSLLEFIEKWEVVFVLPLHAFLVRREFLVRAGARWNTGLYSHEDWDFWLQIMAARPKLETSSEPTAIYRIHADSVTSNRYRCWKGYLHSLAVQRIRYAASPGAQQALDRHYLQMHRLYRKSFPLRRWLHDNLVAKGWFQRHCPWPVQRHLRDFFGA